MNALGTLGFVVAGVAFLALLFLAPGAWLATVVFFALLGGLLYWVDR